MQAQTLGELDSADLGGPFDGAVWRARQGSSRWQNKVLHSLGMEMLSTTGPVTFSSTR